MFSETYSLTPFKNFDFLIIFFSFIHVLISSAPHQCFQYSQDSSAPK